MFFTPGCFPATHGIWEGCRHFQHSAHARTHTHTHTHTHAHTPTSALLTSPLSPSRTNKGEITNTRTHTHTHTHQHLHNLPNSTVVFVVGSSLLWVHTFTGVCACLCVWGGRWIVQGRGKYTHTHTHTHTHTPSHCLSMSMFTCVHLIQMSHPT